MRAEFTPNERDTETTLADLAGYSPVDPHAADTTLTVRDGPFGSAAAIVPRDRWTLKGHVRDDAAAGSSRAAPTSWRIAAPNPPVAGVGLGRLPRHGVVAEVPAGRAGAGAPHATRSARRRAGRFLRTFLYYGFNTDEQGRQVFDGVMAHIAGAARLSLNERGATPNALSHVHRDRVSLRRRGPARSDHAAGPRGCSTTTARAPASAEDLLHEHRRRILGRRTVGRARPHRRPTARSDLTLPDNVRVYFLTGTQHRPGRFRRALSSGQQPDNPVEYWWTMRALLSAMDAGSGRARRRRRASIRGWPTGRSSPADQRRVPAIPGVAVAAAISGWRADRAKPLPFLVPAVDADGNERAGIRTPEIAVPVATYTGWNFREPGDRRRRRNWCR